MRKPRVFIGSARESIHYVNEIHMQLSYIAEVTPWSAGAFQANRYPMEDLEAQVDSNDFAIFVFSPDDLVNMRGKTFLSPRDNSVFEMGLFWGKLRRQRVFCIIPNDTSKIVEDLNADGFHVPSDLSGLNILQYEIRNDSNYSAAVNVACHVIKTSIASEGIFNDPLQEIGVLNQEIMAKNKLLEFFTEFIDPEMLENRYENLYNGLRNSYDLSSLNGFQVRGGAVWKANGTEGIGFVAGTIGRDRYYLFADHADKNEGEERILVVDSYLESKVQFTYYGRAAFANEYVLCYPLGKELVVSLHIRGNLEISEENFALLDLANHELLTTLNYLFEG
ncbi:TIR domain-containing protein [Paenibacillus sp. Leaf72]|uniref:TIR domain-containing protein n=1 Tax=Paenibacillus sp. Leaf72 TaxID=1736234 RepID=UPI000700B54E|nr:TIR domain-containing protein [Paenibacillus sp. Leaf72]KQN97001.1 hypothetical protein ASF12_23315 [Paenibacillus sp. Leaf72]